MRHLRHAGASCVAAVTLFVAAAAYAEDPGKAATFAVGAQYTTTHVYVASEAFDAFVGSLVNVFGGATSPRGVFTVTPTASKTISQLVLTPVGTLSVFGFLTPIPYPFGIEQTGYLVTDLDAAVRSAAAHGADIVVAPFDDPIGRDAIVVWPGGVHTQLYWHTKPTDHAPLRSIPENRFYVSAERIDAFVRSFVGFSGGRVVADDAAAPGIEIGKPGETYRHVRVTSGFGNINVAATDGHLPYPFGRELTGYEVADLSETLAKAQNAGAKVLVSPYKSGERRSAILEFPGGYIAEIHAASQ